MERVSGWTGGLLALSLAGYLACEAVLHHDPAVARWAPPLRWRSVELPVVAGRAAGFRPLVADLLWIRTLQYLGDSKSAQAGYPEFSRLVRQVTAVDPSCVQAYASGAAVLMWIVKDPDGATDLLREGLRHNPGYGPFALYLAAFTYYRGEQYDRTIAVLETLVQQGDHPVLLEPILANLYVRVNQWEKARQLWWWMWYHSRSDDNRRLAKTQLERHGFWRP